MGLKTGVEFHLMKSETQRKSHHRFPVWIVGRPFPTEEPGAEGKLEEKLSFADSVGKMCYLHLHAGLMLCICGARPHFVFAVFN